MTVPFSLEAVSGKKMPHFPKTLERGGVDKNPSPWRADEERKRAVRCS